MIISSSQSDLLDTVNKSQGIKQIPGYYSNANTKTQQQHIIPPHHHPSQPPHHRQYSPLSPS